MKKRPYSLVSYYTTLGILWETKEKKSTSIGIRKSKSWLEIKNLISNNTHQNRGCLRILDLFQDDLKCDSIRKNVKSKYPLEEFDDISFDKDSLPSFCFADEKSIIKIYKKEDEETIRDINILSDHCFVMTDENGNRNNGSCVRFYDKMSFDIINSSIFSGNLCDILRLNQEESKCRSLFREYLKNTSIEDKQLLYFVFDVACLLLNSNFSDDFSFINELKQTKTTLNALNLGLETILKKVIINEDDLKELFVSSWEILELKIDNFVKYLLKTYTIYERKAICLLSSLEHFTLYSNILKELISLTRNNESLPISLETIISHIVLEVPEPPPGKLKVVFRLFNTHNKVFSCSKPPINKLPLLNVSLKPLFEKLSCQNLLTVFSALTLERRVIVSSSCLKLLSESVIGLSKLLFPFKWESPFVPVLPRNLIDLVNAPFPYFVGVHSSLVPEDHFLESKCVFVDLDRNTVEVSFGCEISQPPPEALSKLVKSLKRQVYGEKLQALSEQEGNLKHFGFLYNLPEEQFNAGIREVFLLFFVDLLKDYKKCLGGMEVEEAELFDRRRFVTNHSETSIASEFLDTFAGTQMIQMFCEERLFLPERNFEVMFFDGWIDKQYKKNSFHSGVNFLEDSSQEIVTEYCVDSPNLEETHFNYNNMFPLKYNWNSVVKPVPIDKLHRLRRGSHLLKNIKKVSLVLEAVYLSFYTKRTVFGAKFKLIMVQITGGCNELEDLVFFLKEVVSVLLTFLGRIKHTHAEELQGDDNSKLKDEDEFMSTTFWPSFLRSEKAWVSLVEAYSFALKEKILIPLEEMLRKLTNQKKLLQINGKRWFSKVETTKIEVEELKKTTEKSERYVESCKIELNDFHVTVKNEKIKYCKEFKTINKVRRKKNLQRKLVRSIVIAEKTRLDFAEKVAFLNRELVKFSESLSDIFKDIMRNEQRRGLKLKQILEMIVDLSFDFFQNLQKSVSDSLGNAIDTFLQSKTIEKNKNEIFIEEEKLIKLQVKHHFENYNLKEIYLIPESARNANVNVNLSLTEERVELNKHEVYVSLLQNETVFDPFALKGKRIMTNDFQDEPTTEDNFTNWRTHFKQIKKIHNLIVERAEIKAQAYAFMGSAFLQLMPKSTTDYSVRSSSKLPSFFKRYSTTETEQPNFVTNNRDTSLTNSVKQLKIAFGVLGKELLEKGVPSLENDIIYFSKETTTLLRDIQKRENQIKNSIRRKVQTAVRAKDKAQYIYEKEKDSFHSLLNEYNSILQDKSTNTSPTINIKTTSPPPTTTTTTQEEKVIIEEVSNVLFDLISEIENNSLKVKPIVIRSRISIPKQLEPKLKLDKKLSKLHARVESFSKEATKSEEIFENCVTEEQVTREEYIQELQKCFYVFQFEEALRIVCTVRSFRKVYLTFSIIFGKIINEFSRVKNLIEKVDPDADFIVNKRLNSRLEKFSKTALKVLQRKPTQDEFDDFRQSTVDLEEQNLSFNEATFGSCDLSSCGDENKQINFASCMTSYFPTVLSYFAELKQKLATLEVFFHSVSKAFCEGKFYLEVTLKSCQIEGNSLLKENCSVSTFYVNLVKLITTDKEYFTNITKLNEQLEARCWILNKEMTKVVAVHEQRKKYLDEMLTVSEKIVETKTTSYLNLEAHLDVFERRLSDKLPETNKNSCNSSFTTKNPQKKLFSLRNKKEAEFRDMNMAEKEMLLRKGTFDDCLAQILHRLQAHLETYLEDLINIWKTNIDCIALAVGSKDGESYETSILTAELQQITKKNRDDLENTLSEPCYSSSLLLDYFQSSIKEFKGIELLSKQIKTLLSKRLTLFSDLTKELNEYIEKFFSQKLVPFSVITKDSSSALKAIVETMDLQRKTLSFRLKQIKRCSVEGLNVFQKLILFSSNAQNNIRTNSSKVMSLLSKAMKNYKTTQYNLKTVKRKSKTNKSYSKSKSKKLKLKLDKALSSFQVAQQELLDVEAQAKSEVELIQTKKKEYSAFLKLEVSKFAEFCCIVGNSAESNIKEECFQLLEKVREIEPERDVQLFIEWHGKPLSSSTSSFSQRFSFHT